MQHKTIPILMIAVGVLAVVSGFYLAMMTLPKESACACDPAVTLSAGEQCLQDHFLAYQSIPGIDWTTRGPKQERPLASIERAMKR